MTPARWIFGIALVVMVGILGYRVVLGGTDRARARSADPIEQLRTIPLDGDAFANLAAANRAGEPKVIEELHEIAARRDPRDLRARAWLADLHLRAGDYPEAFRQLDVILRLSPKARLTLPPMMVQWADDPAFADALVAALRTDPTWRHAVVAALRADVERAGAGAVFTALNESGDLSEKEVSDWLDALMRADNWGLAYSYWASGLDLEPGVPLPMLYNGGFEQSPTQQGFDWRTKRHSGTYTEFEPAEGAKGNAAHLVFHGRPAEAANLVQALALAPGRYHVSMRVKADSLRSYQGLHWVIACAGQARPLAAGERLEGSFNWRTATLQFEIPANDCRGQWLSLDNPAPAGSAQIVSGEAWVDDMVLRPRGGSAAAPPRN